MFPDDPWGVCEGAGKVCVREYGEEETDGGGHPPMDRVQRGGGNEETDPRPVLGTIRGRLIITSFYFLLWNTGIGHHLRICIYIKLVSDVVVFSQFYAVSHYN